jgi:hypothetical protein
MRVQSPGSETLPYGGPLTPPSPINNSRVEQKSGVGAFETNHFQILVPFLHAAVTFTSSEPFSFTTSTSRFLLWSSFELLLAHRRSLLSYHTFASNRTRLILTLNHLHSVT